MTTCPTCNSPVKIVGHTTKHYEPVEAARDNQIILDSIAFGKKEGFRLAVELLRSEPAISMMDKFSREWADWLESQRDQ